MTALRFQTGGWERGSDTPGLPSGCEENEDHRNDPGAAMFCGTSGELLPSRVNLAVHSTKEELPRRWSTGA